MLSQTCLNLFVDHDDSGAGLNAARACARRWEEAARLAWKRDRHVIEVLIHRPPPGKDWDDATLGEDVP